MLTSDNVHDAEALPEMLQQIAIDSSITQVTGDGAYDTHHCYQATLKMGARPCFPPRVNANRHQPMDEAW